MRPPPPGPAPRAPAHRPAPRATKVGHRLAPKLSASAKHDQPWVDYWATSTWPNWQPFRPNAPHQATYDMHEAARAGIRLMPDQGSLIAGLKARIAELESRGFKLDSQLKLQATVKYLRVENKRLREEMSKTAASSLKSDAQVLQSENSALRSQNLALAAKLHAAEKKLAELGVSSGES